MDLTVLQVIPRLDLGGAERTTIDMVRALTAVGGHALVITQGGRQIPAIEEAGGYVFKHPVASKNPVIMARNVTRLRAVIRALTVDIVHARSRAPAWSAWRAARAEGVGFVTTYHGAYRGRGGVKGLYNSIMTRGDRVIANSHFTAERIVADEPKAASRLRVIPRGVDLERFHPEAVSDERLRLLMTYWGLPQQREHTKSDDERPLRFLLPARLTPWKGHDLALQAFREWRRRGGGAFELVFAGAGEGGDSFPEDLAARIEAYGLSREVRMVGHVQDAPAAYAWADVVLAPSVRPEAFGRTSVEAQAAQKPVLAANHGGARETVLHGETGFLLEPGDVTAWASALEHMARLSPQERAAMGKAGRENAENFSLQAMCRRTLSVYEEVAREKGRLG